VTPPVIPRITAPGPAWATRRQLGWLGFIAGTGFFVAYQAEGPFQELLVMALLVAVVIAVVPDDAGQQAHPPGVGGTGDHRPRS
jgi:hypothetical protein